MNFGTFTITTFISKLAHLVYFILKEYIPLFYIKVEEIFDH